MSSYFITGASGYIGSMISKKLLAEGEKVTVLVRDTTRLDHEILTAANIILADITEEEKISHITGEYDYLIHCAAPTQSGYFISKPVEVIRTIVNGTENILRLARRCGIKSAVYLSSMEIYGQINCSENDRVTENEYGYIDPKSVRSCYPLAKLMAENLCMAYWKEYQVSVKIARLAQIFGREVKKEDRRIFARFGEAVLKGEDIILHTKGDSIGNYCDIDDAVEAVLFILNNGENGDIYNVVNEANTMTVKEMAELVIEKIANGKIGIMYDIPPTDIYGYAPVTKLRLSGQKLRELGWEAKYRLEDMYRKMLGVG